MAAPEPLLTCRLRKGTEGSAAQTPTTGELELANESAADVVLEYDMHPLQYLDLIVTNAAGQVISDNSYGGIFSTLGSVRTLRLKPGAKYLHKVHLLGSISAPVVKAGKYTVRAVYTYHAQKIESEPLEIELVQDEHLRGSTEAPRTGNRPWWKFW